MSLDTSYRNLIYLKVPAHPQLAAEISFISSNSAIPNPLNLQLLQWALFYFHFLPQPTLPGKSQKSYANSI